MHADYALLNVLFLAPLVALAALYWRRAHTKVALLGFGVLCVLTAVFDNVLIVMGVMEYDPAQILGIKIGLAPLEDFAYTLAAVLLVALLWERGESK